MTPKKEAEILFPEATCLIGGEKITVSPFNFGQTGKALKILVPLSASVDLDFANGELEISKINLNVFLYAVTDGDCEGVFDLVSMATSKPIDWVKSLPGADGTKLLKMVYETAIKPMLAELKKLMPERVDPPVPTTTAGQT